MTTSPEPGSKVLRPTIRHLADPVHLVALGRVALAYGPAREGWRASKGQDREDCQEWQDAFHEAGDTWTDGDHDESLLRQRRAGPR